VTRRCKAELITSFGEKYLRKEWAEATGKHPEAPGLPRGSCCNWQGLSPVLMPLTGLAPASPYFGLRAMGRLSFPK